MTADRDRVSLWKSAWERWQGGWQHMNRQSVPPAQGCDAPVAPGALQLSLYTSRVSLVPDWEFFGSPSLPVPPASRCRAASPR
jgi:hypothetical protein